MAGYVHQRKTYRLVFEGNLDGLEVVTKTASVAAYERIASFASREWSNPLSTEDLAEFDQLCASFADVLVSWNLEEEHEVKGKSVRKPVPPTLKGLKDQDLELVMGIVMAWMDAIAGRAAVSADFEASLPMDVPNP